MDCVVGSGPSATACADALLAAGRQVVMVDVGLRLEPERRETVAEFLRSGVPLRPETAPWLSQRAGAPLEKIPKKLLFGSDYPFRAAVEELRVTSDGVGVEPTFALGGFSTVWGAQVAPYRAGDIADWPISLDQLAPHYEACLRITGIAGERDELAGLLPLHATSLGKLAPSRQALQLAQTMERHRGGLRDAGLYFGRARVAIRADATDTTPGCVYCGLCLHGCPHEIIFNAEQTVAAFRRNDRFSYRPNIVVQSVGDTSFGARVSGRDRLTGESVSIEADRVFVAAGTIPTTQILLRSLAAYDHPLHMLDSQYFLLPLLLARGVDGVRNEALHTLCQMFVEIIDPGISPYTVHLQVYSYNDLIGAMVRQKLGPLAGALEAVARQAEGRLMLIQGYLHSAHSSKIATTLRGTLGADRLDLAAVINPEARRVIGKVVRKLLRQAPRLGAIPLPMLLEVATPGRGFHTGGAFPMRAEPGAFETDTLGRPAGMRRVHAVDATVFPSIAATTITLTAMANAHRIASEVAAIG